MKNFINNIIENQKFNPTLLGMFLNPFWFARKNILNNNLYLDNVILAKFKKN